MEFRLRTRSRIVMTQEAVMSRTARAAEARRVAQEREAAKSTRLVPEEGMVFEKANPRFGELPTWNKVTRIAAGVVYYQQVLDDGRYGLPRQVAVVAFPGIVLRVVEAKYLD